MSAQDWFARHVTYPLHERLRGRHTLRELHALARLAALPPVAVQRQCAAHLRDLLCFAEEHLPYFGPLFKRCGLDSRAADPYAELAKLPALSKADLRAHRDEMVYRAVPGGPIPHSSGGTSGDTLHFFIDRIRQAQQLAARLFMQGLFDARTSGVPPSNQRRRDSNAGATAS